MLRIEAHSPGVQDRDGAALAIVLGPCMDGSRLARRS
jgi:hypothetical protein